MQKNVVTLIVCSELNSICLVAVPDNDNNREMNGEAKKKKTDHDVIYRVPWLAQSISHEIQVFLSYVPHLMA